MEEFETVETVETDGRWSQDIHDAPYIGPNDQTTSTITSGE